ncbi:MAG: hypothetical protein ABW216_11930, partial [Candidatus Rokuibacteriota bacterium]
PEWLARGGIRVKDLRTPGGMLSYSLRRDGGNLILQVAGGMQVPAGGFVLVWPGPHAPPARTRVNGEPARWEGRELRFRQVPATVVIGGRP